MQRLKNWKRTTGTAIGLSCLLLCFVLPGEVGGGCASAWAQGPNWGGGSAPGNTPAKEITVQATIRQVMLGQGGDRLLVSAPVGNFDAALGPYVPAEVRQALTVGTPVELTGTLRSVNGKDILLVRQLTVAGHQVTLRNANGFLMRGPAPGGSGTGKSHNGSGNGGNQ
jgi:hypothetical protein